MVGAELERVFFLVGGMGEDPDFCAQGFGPEKAEVA
jgi:hypothetical protein